MNIYVYVRPPNCYDYALSEWVHFLIQMDSFRINILIRVSSQSGV